MKTDYDFQEWKRRWEKNIINAIKQSTRKVEEILKDNQEAAFKLMLGHPNNIKLARDIALQNQVDNLKGN